MMTAEGTSREESKQKWSRFINWRWNYWKKYINLSKTKEKFVYLIGDTEVEVSETCKLIENLSVDNQWKGEHETQRIKLNWDLKCWNWKCSTLWGKRHNVIYAKFVWSGQTSLSHLLDFINQWSEWTGKENDIHCIIMKVAKE